MVDLNKTKIFLSIQIKTQISHKRIKLYLYQYFLLRITYE